MRRSGFRPRQVASGIAQSPVGIEAQERNLTMFKPDDLNDLKLKQSIKALSVDFVVVAAYVKNQIRNT